jgi:WD40 repeat protein
MFRERLPFLAGQKDVHATLSADGRLLALWAPPGYITFYDWQEWRVITALELFDEGVALSPDGQAVALTQGRYRWISRSHLHREGRSSKWAAQWTYSRDGEEFHSLTFTPDGAWLVAATQINLLLWARESQAPLVIPHSPGFMRALTSDGQTLVAANSGTLQFLDLRDLRWDGAGLELEAEILSLARSQDGRLLAAGCANGQVVLIDPHARTVQGTLLGHRHEVTALAFAPDGRTLVSGSKDGTVRLWNLATQQELFILEDRLGTTINSVAFTPDGTTLITAGDPVGDFSNVMFWSAPREEGR